MAEQESRVKPTAETWGNRPVMRDGYLRHPSTNMGAHSNPQTPVHMGHKEHMITHARKGQACKHTQTPSHAHKYLHTSHLYCTCISTFVSVHIEHINSCLIMNVSSQPFLCASIFVLLLLLNSRDPSHSIFPSQETAPRPCCSPEVQSSVQHTSLTPES